MPGRGRKQKASGLSPDQDAIVKNALARVEKAAKDGKSFRDGNIDKSYVSEYKRFIIWVVKNNKQPNPTEFPLRFMTRQTVDAYYLADVPKREFGSKGTLTRIGHALQKLWDEVESQCVGDEKDSANPPALLMEGEDKSFKVDASEAVKEGEKQQQRNYALIAKIKNGGVDPFKGLKLDLLTNKDKKTLARYILASRRDWNDLLCSFNLGCNAGVRGKSTRSLCLKDITVSHGFAPKQGKSLTVILRKDDQKVTYQVDRLVGCLRHREYLLCAVFSTALNVVQLLLERGHEIHFKRGNPKVDAKWWHESFVKFDKLEDEQNAMVEVYKNTGVKSCKVTHHRSHCVMYASTEGLQQYQVSTLTKHEKASLDKSYWAEMERQTLTVMAGFEMSEAYFVPRTEIGLPHGTTIERCMELIFGTRYHKWKDEQASAEGDHSECGTRFFTRLLPYLVEVLVQDGIYLINDFPTHPMSVHLRNKLGGEYESWAREKRTEVERKLETFEPNRIAALGEATQRAFQALEAQNQNLMDAVVRGNAKMIELTNQVALLKNSLELRNSESLSRTNDLKKDLAEHSAQVQGMLQSFLQQQRELQLSTPRQQERVSTGTAAGRTNSATSDVNQTSIPPDVNHPSRQVNAPQPQEPLPEQRLRGPQDLQSVPYQPPMSADFPKTWVNILKRWRTANLQEFMNHDRGPWSEQNKKRYLKMLRAYQCIERAAKTHSLDLDNAAVHLDTEMGREEKTTMTKFLEKKIKEHPDVQVRNRKRKEAASPNPTNNNNARKKRRKNSAPMATSRSSTNNQQSTLKHWYPPVVQHPASVAALPAHLRNTTHQERMQRDLDDSNLEAVARRAAARRKAALAPATAFLQRQQGNDANKKPAARPTANRVNPKPPPMGMYGTVVYNRVQSQTMNESVRRRLSQERRERNYTTMETLENADRIGARQQEITAEEIRNMHQRATEAYNRTGRYPPGRCGVRAVRGGCKYPDQELRPGHKCRHCGIIVHNLCGAEPHDEGMKNCGCRDTS